MDEDGTDALERYAADRLVRRVLEATGYVVVPPRPQCIVPCGRCECLTTHYVYAAYWECGRCGEHRVPYTAEQLVERRRWLEGET